MLHWAASLGNRWVTRLVPNWANRMARKKAGRSDQHWAHGSAGRWLERLADSLADSLGRRKEHHSGPSWERTKEPNSEHHSGPSWAGREQHHSGQSLARHWVVRLGKRYFLHWARRNLARNITQGQAAPGKGTSIGGKACLGTGLAAWESARFSSWLRVWVTAIARLVSNWADRMGQKKAGRSDQHWAHGSAGRWV